ncbi:thioredoxin family protein [Rapidithrix thailandica]|uniref:Thioredoxin family protein n=1 Tax=Rapidithrix thailandica TaxID=413964 RepID=A0AAW9RNJ1_9BACT
MKFIQKIILGIFFITWSIGANAEGIRFFEGTWEKALQKAKASNKFIFVDFYTTWCGPCKWMADKVFPQEEVGAFYNENFVCVKIDAEKGAGVALSKKYEVKVFPTYAYIDPATEEAVHVSTSRQEGPQFVQTAKDALDPNRQSVRLKKQFAGGERSPEFLYTYVRYLASCYKREEIQEIVTEYFTQPNVELTDTLSWYFTREFVRGTDSPQFQHLLDNRDTYAGLYGQEEVDKKIATEYSYDANGAVYPGIYRPENFDEAYYQKTMEKIKKAANFPGKHFLLKRVHVLYLLGKGKYQEAADHADAMLTTEAVKQKEILSFYYSLTTLTLHQMDDPKWVKRCLQYAQYVAYNDPERDNVSIHFNYARMLEKAMKAASCAKEIAPEAVLAKPQHGKKEYNLRSPKLAPKPKRKK